MPDPFRKISPNEPVTFSATVENAKLDAARAEQARKHNRGGGPQTQTRNATIIRVTNETGLDMPQFGVVGLSEPIFLPTDSLEAFKREVAFRGVVPTTEHVGRFAILLEPVANEEGRVTRAVVSGVCPVLVDVLDTSHRFADVDNGEPSNLLSGAAGSAEILWKESDDPGYGYDTGLQWAIVRIGGGGSGAGSLIDAVIADDVPPAVWSSGHVEAASGTAYPIDSAGDVSDTPIDFVSRYPDGVAAARFVKLERKGSVYHLVLSSCSTVPAPPYY